MLLQVFDLNMRISPLGNEKNDLLKHGIIPWHIHFVQMNFFVLSEYFSNKEIKKIIEAIIQGYTLPKN